MFWSASYGIIVVTLQKEQSRAQAIGGRGTCLIKYETGHEQVEISLNKLSSTTYILGLMPLWTHNLVAE